MFDDIFNELNQDLSQMILESLRADLTNYNSICIDNKFQSIEIANVDSRVTAFYIAFEIFTIQLYSFNNDKSVYAFRAIIAFNGTQDYSIENFKRVLKEAIPSLNAHIKNENLIKLDELSFEIVNVDGGNKGYEFTYVSRGHQFDIPRTFSDLHKLTIRFHETMTIFSEQIGREFNRFHSGFYK